MTRKNVIIIGAAGRDFHNFNTCYRDNENYNVVAFTAAQIPDIDGRKYPGELAGKFYPDGIPIYNEESLPDLIKKFNVSDCVFSYSDITYQKVMSVGAIVNSAGCQLCSSWSFSYYGKKHQTGYCCWCNKDRLRKEPDLKEGN